MYILEILLVSKFDKVITKDNNNTDCNKKCKMIITIR